MADACLNRRGEGYASQPRGAPIEGASKAVGAVVSAASFATLAPRLGWSSARASSWRSVRNRLSSSLPQPDSPFLVLKHAEQEQQSGCPRHRGKTHGGERKKKPRPRRCQKFFLKFKK